MKKKILVVDDDAAICEILSFNLKSEGYEILVAYSAEEALPIILSHSDISLLLLDVMMSGMSGYHLVETIRGKGIETPVIFITAKDQENDLLTGFSVGGDDYIAKPFSIKEVVARIKALLKRGDRQTKKAEETDSIILGDLVLYPSKKEVFLKGSLLSLTKTEYEILVLLMTHAEKVFSREDIIQVVWAETPYITERTVDVHITRLRKKMGEYGACITNRSGYGYRFNATVCND